MRSASSLVGKITCVLDGPSGRRIYDTTNLISNAGDVFYAQKMAGEVPTNSFANLVLGSGSSSPTKTSTYNSITVIANTNKAPEATYPKTNDADADNSYAGANVVTYKYYYGKTDFTAASITEGVITVASPTSGSPVLCHFRFPTGFEKTADDTLTVFVNHESEGVASSS